MVPVTINGTITLGFVIDSGSADVSVPVDVAMTLYRTGTVRDIDFLGSQTYRLADGSTVPSPTFRIRSLKVGNQEVHDVVASISNIKGSLLLGQSFLQKFPTWSIDNQRRVLVLGDAISEGSFVPTASEPPPGVETEPTYTAPATAPAVAPTAAATVPAAVSGPASRHRTATDVASAAGSLDHPSLCRGSHGPGGLGELVQRAVR